ncbi:MAG: DNA-binding protein [Moraxellaceae bacterium]|nr:MAG: DNA-binding protein [Moraxellaceae bacterium]
MFDLRPHLYPVVAPDSFILQLTVRQLQELINEAIKQQMQALVTANQKPADAASDLFTMKTLPGYVHMSRSKLYKLVAAGKIPHYHCGQKLLFRKGEIDAWLDQHRVI